MTQRGIFLLNTIYGLYTKMNVQQNICLFQITSHFSEMTECIPAIQPDDCISLLALVPKSFFFRFMPAYL